MPFSLVQLACYLLQEVSTRLRLFYLSGDSIKIQVYCQVPGGGMVTPVVGMHRVVYGGSFPLLLPIVRRFRQLIGQGGK